MDLRSKDAIESSKQHDIEMSNILIAEFMGIDQVDIDTYQETNSNLKYHSSWDWLMPVISKCYKEHNRDAYFIQYNKYLLESIKNCDIDKAHQIVVDFIKNQNN